MEEDLNKIEEFLKTYSHGYFGVLKVEQLKILEHLIKAYKELKEENAILKKANNISENVTIQDITNFMNKSIEDFNKEYIPVALIKETIKEYNQKIEKYYEYKNQGKETDVEFYENITNIEIVRVLQKILEVK